MPKTLNIMGKTFQIRSIKELKQDNEFVCGICNVCHHVIEISSEYPPESQESTLLHEIIEAINGLTEMGLRHKQIATLETCLHQVLKDNKLHFDKVGD